MKCQQCGGAVRHRGDSLCLRCFATLLNNLSPEQIACAMESLPTDVLEWAVRFEALAHVEKWPS